MEPFKHAVWIWNEGGPDEVNQYVEFRHEFVLDQAMTDAGFYISVDSDYVLWINGTFADAGQYDDYPDHKAYDCLAIGHLLRRGNNVISILAHYQGEDSFQYIKGNPGLIYALETEGATVVSGKDTYYRVSPTYVSGPVPKITNQLGFTFEYDAAKHSLWRDVEYEREADWKRYDPEHRTTEMSPALYPRPIRKLELNNRCTAHIVSQGLYVRQEVQGATVAELMQQDYLSYRLPEVIVGQKEPSPLPRPEGCAISPELFRADGGLYLLLDLGREECGYLELELEAEVGTTIDIAYGEHLDDLRVRSHARGKNFAVRYRCGDGRQMFTYYFKRMAGRYLQLHISGVKEKLVLYYAGLRPAEYPVEAKGKFDCPDSLHRQIEKIAVRTLHLCMHEHYEDTPWREQALYAMDSRNQALCGYYSFGEYEFPAASFRLLAEGLKEDGFLTLTAPSVVPIAIPSFSFLWVVALEEHLLYSGNTDQAKQMLGYVHQMLKLHIYRMREQLLVTPEDPAYWNFYDWAPGMHNWKQSAVDSKGNIRCDAPLNLFFAMALDAAGIMERHCGSAERSQYYLHIAKQVKKAFHERFWDAERLAYRTYLGGDSEDHYAELTQALALCAGACPEGTAERLRAKLAAPDNGFIPVTLSYSYFKYKALLDEPDQYGTVVFGSIAEDWGGMLYRGATSFWETKGGAADFGLAGSLCHGWSAIPIYFYYAYILGIRPLEPGFKRFRVEPIQGIFHQASGTIPTPYGDIHVKWSQSSEGLMCNVIHPQETYYS
ncbi:family 78 glycoside hydrolase catalytic domain [Paenibacillus agaridevorans]|uniref:family 78 glycoside hydrolase catalytic domain n=1 Tax=Paenibacillus agaridevorans TaxID=171404 RepID=UPI001BE41FF1|nr:family 78 glycoside hydrolase catalytic domain [Paenibacillus agaridevorans]